MSSNANLCGRNAQTGFLLFGANRTTMRLLMVRKTLKHLSSDPDIFNAHVSLYFRLRAEEKRLLASGMALDFELVDGVVYPRTGVRYYY